MAVLGLAILMLPIAPLATRYSAGGVWLFLAATLLSRNIAVVTGVVLFLNLAYRFFYPGSAWHDQPWAQWYSISSLLTGHNLFVASPLVGMSMSSYLPMGDVFGGVFIALGIDQYWRIWHVVVPCLLLIPVLAAPSASTLMIFMGTVSFFPFCDYTTAGGTLEISFALVMGAVALFRCGRVTESLPLFAFAALFRQPNIMLAPFVFLALWKNGDIRRTNFFAALLFVFGGVYILLDPRGAYLWLFRFFEVFQQSFYNDHHGLNENYSISSLPHTFGIDDGFAWGLWPPAYPLLTCAGIAALFFLAWRTRSREHVIFLGVLATIFVYLFSRGYALYHYVAATAMPLAMFQFTPGPMTRMVRCWSAGLALFIVWVGAVPLIWFVMARAETGIWNLHRFKSVPVASTLLVNADGTRVPVPKIDGVNRETYTLGQVPEFDFAEPVRINCIRLSGDHVGNLTVKGVNLPWASETEMRGVIERGEILYSEDGTHFNVLQRIDNHISYSAYPVRIDLNATPGPVRAIRIRADKLYQEHKEWILGNVEFFAAPSKP